MKTYTVQIKETLRKNIIIEAESPEEAEEMVRDSYRQEEIVLESEDFDEVDFSVYNN